MGDRLGARTTGSALVAGVVISTSVFAASLPRSVGLVLWASAGLFGLLCGVGTVCATWIDARKRAHANHVIEQPGKPGLSGSLVEAETVPV